MSQRPNKPAPVVVKRPPEQRRKLPPDLEAFARSDDEKLRIRRPRVDRGLIRDPREGYTVAGVANRDARAVYDVRSVAMRALWDDGAADERALATLGQLFHDALRLELWHARRLTSFAAFAEEVVGVPAERAEALADEAAQRTGEPVTPLTEVAIALWLRTEAGLYEGDEGGRARVRSGDNGLVLELVVDLQEASTALAGVGARHLPLARSTPQREEARGSRDDSRGSHEDRRPYEEPRAARAAQVERTREAPRPAAPAEPDYEEDTLHEEPLASELPEAGDESALESALDEAGVERDALEAEHAADAAADEGEEAGVASDEGDEGDDDDAPERVVGGARLLTRKPQLPREDSAAAAVEGGEHWGRREPRGERPGVAGASPGERPKFGADRGGSPRDRGERPKFGADRGGSPRDRGGERPKFAGNDRSGGGERPRFGGGNDRTGGGERPRFGGNDRGGERPRPGGFGQAGERPKFAGNDRSGGGERPRFG
ncbi:MAG: hypothetical protein JWN48_1338, partial [Myxococcaceae bacterium]|nr:hypothetical protein [Myxococcaceae bacterium]